MKFPTRFFKKSVANIEFKDDCIRYVEIKQTNPLVVSQAGEYYFGEGIIEQGRIINRDAFSTILENCIQKWRIKRKSVRFLIPDSAVVVRTIDVPVDVPNHEIIGHLYFELDHSIHLPFDQPVMDAAVLHENDKTKKVLLVAAPEEVVQTFSSELKDKRTNPIVADISSLSLYRLFHHFQLTSDDEHYLLIQMNMRTVTISIFDEDRPSFMQQFPIPYGDDVWQPKISHDGATLDMSECNEKLVLSAIQDIFIEIDRILRFYQYSLHSGTQEITKILLSGDHPFFEKIMFTMKDRFNLPMVTIHEEFVRINGLDTSQAKWFNVLGLAVREGNEC